MPTNAHTYYSTEDELRFLRGLGTYRVTPGKFTTAELLRGYLKGCELREDWGNIDKRRVVEMAEGMLASLT